MNGAIHFAGIVAHTVFLVRQSRRETAAVAEEYDEAFGPSPARGSSWAVNVALVVLGLTLPVLGARWLVAAAIDLAEALGVSELVIGLTIMAAGTSLREVATSVLASVQGERDIAVGNVVGSNLFNLLAVGFGSLLSPEGVPVSPRALSFDMLVMIGAAVAALPIFFTRYMIARWAGAVFLGYYVAYTVHLVLDATEHAQLPAYGVAMVWFVLLLTALTLAVLAIRAHREKRRDSPEPP